jgi:hypothetical protein
MATNIAYDIQEGFSFEDGVLHLALTNSIGNKLNENVILSFYINDNDYLPGYYQGFVNKDLDEFLIIKNDTMDQVDPIPNMYHNDPYFQSCYIKWTPNLISTLLKFLSKEKDLTDKVVLNEIFTLCKKITGYQISN